MNDVLDLDGVTLEARLECWPLTSPFRIARGEKSEAIVLVATARLGNHVGWGEAVPYARYGKGAEATRALAQTCRAKDVESLPPGAARNALECALLDLEANVTRVPVFERLELPAPRPVEIAATLSIDRPDAMAARARDAGARLLKLKLGGDGLDLERLEAVRDASPDARLWLDANEGLTPVEYDSLAPHLLRLGVVLFEQPLPQGQDRHLCRTRRDVPVCADESAHDAASLDALVDRYDAVNVKLDKTGGLREAAATIARARVLNLRVVLGCMVATSLSIAPASLLAPLSDFADLDGALWLAKDREGCGRLENGRLTPPTLWGTPR